MKKFLIFYLLLSMNLFSENMKYLDNGKIKIGVDLDLGGAITFLAPAGKKNMINNYDYGRQIQMSFYSGPVPYVVDGKSPKDHQCA